MANPEHLGILKQGVEVWNRWREQNPNLRPDLSRVDLSDTKIHRINFIKANLSQSVLNNSDLSWAKLGDANLSEAYLFGTNFTRADLSQTNLRGADLSEVNFFETRLIGADLRQANLIRAQFTGADLSKVDLSGAIIGKTNLGDVNLSVIEGLPKVIHQGPSYIDLHTLQRSRGKIPEIFLRGIGVSDTFITYIASLTDEAIQYYSCFISYSSKDEVFAQRLHADLQQKGIRCWFAPEDMKIGDKIRPAIDQSVRLHDKLLLILSKNSLNSFWVESEVEKAFEEERQRGQTVLFPVRLDEAVMETDRPWATEIRRTRHIGDFTRWKDHNAYQQVFERLLRDLKTEK